MDDRLQAVIKQKRWGLSPTVEDDDDGKWDKVMAVTRGVITQKKSEVKKLVSLNVPRHNIRFPTQLPAQIGQSYDLQEVQDASEGIALKKGKDIISLCEALLKIGSKKIPAGTNINVTPQLCMRVAFLVRQIIIVSSTSRQLICC